MSIKVGINGMGRIGRAFTRIASARDDIEIVAINTRKSKNDMMAYLLQYDSVYRKFSKKVEAAEDGLVIDGRKIPTLLNDTPQNIPWSDYGVEVVVYATGAFNTTEDLSKHTSGTVKKVLLTAPSNDDATPHVVLGVNDDTFDWSTPVISNASCTTNCAAPLMKVLQDNFGVVHGMLSTIHAVTLTQSMLDDIGKSPDRSRAAFQNTIPSTSGAAKAVAKVIPALEKKLEVGSIRVPVPTGSMTECVVLVEKDVTVEMVNEAFKKASESMPHILGYETVMLVSSDYIGDSRSSIFDANYTKVLGSRMVKVVGWYDNEWGYSSRLVDVVARMGS